MTDGERQDIRGGTGRTDRTDGEIKYGRIERTLLLIDKREVIWQCTLNPT